MDKKILIEKIRAALSEELAVIAASAEEARREATHEDALPENQYDTRGLEASYLAGAQASRAQDLAHRLSGLDFIVPRAFGEADRIGLTALIEVDDGEQTKHYFIFPEGGGMKIPGPKGTVVVVTPQSPLGRAFIERKLGDIVGVRLRGQLVEFEVTSVE